MAKKILTATTNFNELISDLLLLAEDFPDEVKEAGGAQLNVLSEAIKTNWASMVPHGQTGDYVYDSIGFNVEHGDDKDVVGMAGVFLIDAVTSKHGYDVPRIIKTGPNKGAQHTRIKAPQLAYWAEFGYTPNNAGYQAGVPYMSNAFYATIDEQDKAFADSLDMSIKKRLMK